MKAWLCRNPHKSTAQWNVTSFFFQWLTSCPSDRCCFSFWVIDKFHKPIPDLFFWNTSRDGTLEFATIPISPLINVSSPSRCWGICKVTVSRQGIVQSLLQSHPEETQYGWFCRNGLKDGKTWNCFFSDFLISYFVEVQHVSSRTCHKSCWLELSRSSSVGYGEQQLSLLCNAYARLEVLSGVAPVGWRTVLACGLWKLSNLYFYIIK